jgi:hypothetical protein
MKKANLFLPILWCYFISCSQPSIDDNRRTTMTEIVNSIIKNDTTKIFALVDTSNCFDINSKESFLFNIQSLSAVFSKEPIQISKNDFLPIVSSGYNGGDTTYKITFLLKKSDFDKIDMDFRFNHGVFNVVYYFNAYFIKNKGEPLDAAPSGN